MFYQTTRTHIHHEDCLTAVNYYPDGRFQLCLTSTPYPGQRGFGLTVPEYFEWWKLRLEAIKPKLHPQTGVLVQNVKFKRRYGWFDSRVFKLTDIFVIAGFNIVDVYIWDKLNSPPSGNQNRHDRDEWELCYVLARSKNYLFNPVRRPYSPKSIKQGKAKPRKPDANGSMANGHRRLHEQGARQSNVLRISSSADLGRPRVQGGSFPRALARRFILQHSNPGDWVLDPCSGAGTTVVTAMINGRKAVGMDISQQAVETAVRWLEKTTPHLTQ